MGPPPPPELVSQSPVLSEKSSQSGSSLRNGPWVSLVKGIPMSITDFQPDFDVENGVAKVLIPQEVIGKSEPLWKCYAVGVFMGDAPHVGSIHATVNRIWTVTDRSSKIDVQFLNKTMVLFRIENSRIREHVLQRRYWHIANVPLVLSEWNPETAQAPPDLTAMPLWVDLKGVPAHLFSHEGLGFLSSTAGNFVKLHPNTERCIRLDVARILVEVNLQKPLVDQICFPDQNGEMVSVSVTYPWLPPKCSLCLKWGHTSKECSTKVTILVDPVAATKKQGTKEWVAKKQVNAKTVQDMANELLQDLERSPVYPVTSALDKTPSQATQEPAIEKAAEETVRISQDLHQTIGEKVSFDQEEERGQVWTEVNRKSPHTSPSRKVNGKPEHSTVVSPNGFGVLGKITAGETSEVVVAAIEEKGDSNKEEGEIESETEVEEELRINLTI